MQKDKLKIYFLEFILLVALSFILFVPRMYNKILLAGILTFFSIIICCFIKVRKPESIYTSKVKLLLIIFGAIYIIAFYVMGLYFDYYKSAILFGFKTLINYIIPITVIIITSEVIRNVFLVQNTKLTSIITSIIMILIDLIIYVDVYNLDTYTKIIETITFIFFASVACNLLYNYISKRYGYKGNIYYRLITILYAYIIPYIPNVYVFFRSILRIIYPYIIYLVLEYTFTNTNKVVSYENKKRSIINKIVLGITIILFAMLISCEFRYGILVIGSGSMTGAINKGDAVVFEQYNENIDINEGEVIVFNKDNLNVVHRVIDVRKVNGEMRYTTKGDANSKNDEGYITKESIVGICKFRILFIGYPTIWIRNILSN